MPISVQLSYLLYIVLYNLVLYVIKKEPLPKAKVPLLCGGTLTLIVQALLVRITGLEPARD